MYNHMSNHKPSVRDYEDVCSVTEAQCTKK